MGNTEAALLDESVAEIQTLLNSRNYYVGHDGAMVFSSATDVVNLITACMTE